MILDMFGKQCPMPLVAAKKELEAGCDDLHVRVDNETAVKNLARLADKTGRAVQVTGIEGGWLVSFGDAGEATAEAYAAAPAAAPAACSMADSCGYAVFVGKDVVGAGDPTLGGNLMKMALYTFSQAELPPASMLFMNAGVKLLCEEGQTVECVRALEERGTEVLVCGTCLDFYGVKEQLLVGEVSNMYDILGRMQEAAKVITL